MLHNNFITPGGLRIVGVQAMSGIHSSIHVETQDREDILFDCGIMTCESIKAKWVFITHGHVDHVGAAVQHARARALNHSPATYFIPEEVLAPLVQAHDAFEKLDGHKIPFQIQVLRPGESVNIGKKDKFRVTAFQTEHRVQSQGYAVFSTIEKEPAVVLEEYKHLSRDQRRELKQQGISVERAATTEEILDLVYTGDTTFNGLLAPHNAFIFNASMLIMECTYLDGDVQKAVDWQHVHLQDIIDHAGRFSRVQYLVLTHLSAKYQPWSRALNILQKSGLPAGLIDRTYVTLRTFGASEDVTAVAPTEDFSSRKKTEVGFTWATRVGGGSNKATGESTQKRVREGRDDRCRFFFHTAGGCLKGADCEFSHQ